jgi:ribosome biogenesis GTPase A
MRLLAFIWQPVDLIPLTGVFPGIVTYFTNIYTHLQDSLQRKATSETFKLLNENVLQVVRNFLKLVDGPKEGEAAGRIQSELEQYRRGLFRLVVVGEIKKGKSSFINALLGEPYPLPVMSDVATSTVFKVTYGDTRKYKVFL